MPPNYGPTMNTMSLGDMSQTPKAWTSDLKVLPSCHIVVLEALTPFYTQVLVLWLGMMT